MVVLWPRCAPPYGGRCEATLRAGAVCPHGCVTARLCIDIHLPRSSLPCGQTADGATVWGSVNRPWIPSGSRHLNAGAWTVLHLVVVPKPIDSRHPWRACCAPREPAPDLIRGRSRLQSCKRSRVLPRWSRGSPGMTKVLRMISAGQYKNWRPRRDEGGGSNERSEGRFAFARLPGIAPRRTRTLTRPSGTLSRRERERTVGRAVPEWRGEELLGALSRRERGKAAAEHNLHGYSCRGERGRDDGTFVVRHGSRPALPKPPVLRYIQLAIRGFGRLSWQRR